MKKPNITSKDFRDFVMSVLEKQNNNYNGSLEEYLRSLWCVVNEYKEYNVNFSLLATIIENAFKAKPALFEQKWLSYNNPLNWNYRDGTYVIEQLEGHRVKVVASNVDDFDILKHTLLFQIADLHRMRNKQIKDEYRYFGIDSPTGNRWYNFDVFTFLECGTR